MKNSTYRIILVLLSLVIVLGGGMLVYRQWSADLAPDFTVVDAEGNAHKLSDYRGKPVILNFWASWCGPCRNEMPEFEKAWQEYGDEIQFMMVNLTDGYSDTKETADQVIEEGGYTFPVFYDTAMEAAGRYDTSAIPVSCFIDAHGKLVYQKVGMLTGDELQQWIDTLLS